MNEYYLELAGLNIVLRTPQAITISENLRPFLCQQPKFADCTISLQLTDSLPDMPEGGVWHGPEYYDCAKRMFRVFHCETPNTAPFAVTQLFEEGNIQIQILPEYGSYFSGTAGIFNRIGMETLLLQHTGLMLHASLIKYKGKAIAFAGPSGVGKSTQADLWKKHLAAQVINGDRAALRNSENGWVAYGSPYAGTSGIYHNDSAPLAAIVILQKAQQNRFCRLTPADGFRHLYPELSVHKWDKAFVERATDLCLLLLAQTPVYLLACRPEEEAVLLVKKGLGL